MDNVFVSIGIGLMIGTFGTLIGAGGGFILVPLLLLTEPTLPPDVITAISIAVVALNAISGSVAYARAKRIDYKAGILFSAFTIPGSIIGVFLIKYIPKHIFNIAFGIILIALATYLLSNRTKANNNQEINITGLTSHELTDKDGTTFSYSFNKLYGIIISVLVGFLSPMLGIGGGIIHVPAMVHWLKFPVYIATATSHFILAIMSTVSVIIHFYQGSYSDAHIQAMLLGLSLGVIPGAQLGAFISHRLSTTLIIQVLAVCLALVGIRILF